MSRQHRGLHQEEIFHRIQSQKHDKILDLAVYLSVPKGGISPGQFFLGRQLSDRINSIQNSTEDKRSKHLTAREAIDCTYNDGDSDTASCSEQPSRMSNISEATRLVAISTGGFDNSISLYQKRIASIALSNRFIAVGSNITEAEIRVQESPFANIKGLYRLFECSLLLDVLFLSISFFIIFCY